LEFSLSSCADYIVQVSSTLPKDGLTRRFALRVFFRSYAASMQGQKKKPATLDRGFPVFSVPHLDMDFCDRMMQ
jgi:hypothetical protein